MDVAPNEEVYWPNGFPNKLEIFEAKIKKYKRYQLKIDCSQGVKEAQAM